MSIHVFSDVLKRFFLSILYWLRYFRVSFKLKIKKKYKEGDRRIIVIFIFPLQSFLLYTSFHFISWIRYFIICIFIWESFYLQWRWRLGIIYTHTFTYIQFAQINAMMQSAMCMIAVGFGNLLPTGMKNVFGYDKEMHA